MLKKNFMMFLKLIRFCRTRIEEPTMMKYFINNIQSTMPTKLFRNFLMSTGLKRRMKRNFLRSITHKKRELTMMYLKFPRIRAKRRLSRPTGNQLSNITQRTTMGINRLKINLLKSMRPIIHYPLKRKDKITMIFFFEKWYQRGPMMFLKIFWGVGSSSFLSKSNFLSPYSRKSGVAILTG